MYSFCFQKQIRENLEARQREQQEWDNQQGFAEVGTGNLSHFNLSIAET